jgi:hypothetical protein
MKSNESWDALCVLTTKLASEFGGRPAAFKEACRRRPDLAAEATDSQGNFLIPRAAKSAHEVEGSTFAVYQALSESPVVKACEALAAAAKR